MKITALAGGVGGAKLADGLAQVLEPEELKIIVNIGDDFMHLGLKICPDLDTVCYTLAGMANPITGWGRADESFRVLSEITKLGGEDWFLIGDQDLSTHILRSFYLSQGLQLSDITQHFCEIWGIKSKILPASDDCIPTSVITTDGTELPFQEYFVRQKCQPAVSGFKFNDVENAKPALGVLESIEEADIVVICPSNPWVSIYPILSIPGIKEAISRKTTIAVSPIIGGATIKGPAAKMYAELGIKPSAFAVAESYQGIIKGLVIDEMDINLKSQIDDRGIITLVTNIIMIDRQDRVRLAREIVDFCDTSFLGVN